MKRIALPLVVFLLIGCGGGGGGGGTTTHAPVISNLSYSPTRAVAGAGGGSVTIVASLDFSDNGGDLTLARLSAYDNNGTMLWTRSEPILDVSGDTSGIIEGSIVLATTYPGVFTFRIQFEDAKGSSSNVLEGTIKVIDAQFAPMAISTPMADTVAGGGSKFYSTDVTQGIQYTVGITGLSGPANLVVFNNDNTLQAPACGSTNASATSILQNCTFVASAGLFHIEVDAGPSTEPVSYTILAAPNPVITNPVSQGSRQSPVSIPHGIPTQGQVETRGESFYNTTGLTPAQPVTVSIIGLSADADLRVFSDETYSFELDCTLRRAGDVTNDPEECTTVTSGTLYFSIRSGELNLDGAGYLILVE